MTIPNPTIYQVRSDVIMFTTDIPGKNLAKIGGFAIKQIPKMHVISDINNEKFNLVSLRIIIE